MTLIFRVRRSISFECFIENCCILSIFDITRFGPSVHRITTTNHDIIIFPMHFKAVTFDLDLEREKKKWQEPFMKPTHEVKHFAM